MTTQTRLPVWLKKPLSDPGCTRFVRAALSSHRLNTVCDEARCPNRGDCFGRGTATFMILGDRCTRDCRFCAVRHADPHPVDKTESDRVADAAATLGLSYVVVTSVTRDDLPDGGAAHFAATVRSLRDRLPDAGIEVLVPDFGGSLAAVDTVLDSAPDVFGHNVESVQRLYEQVRPGADYRRSLGILSRASAREARPMVKSSLMLGMGETEEELRTTLRDLRAAGVDTVCLGQYLKPAHGRHEVARFVTPSEFDDFRAQCEDMGFAWVSAGPFVRSSYRAEEAAAEVRDRLGMGARRV